MVFDLLIETLKFLLVGFFCPNTILLMFLKKTNQTLLGYGNKSIPFRRNFFQERFYMLNLSEHNYVWFFLRLLFEVIQPKYYRFRESFALPTNLTLLLVFSFHNFIISDAIKIIQQKKNVFPVFLIMFFNIPINSFFPEI